MDQHRYSYDEAAAATLISPPLAHDAQLWRYMDLGKFLHFLEYKQLFFCRGDLFEDPNEGMPTTQALKEYEEQMHHAPMRPPGWLPAPDAALISRRHAFVSCWHHNEGESLAMWSLYGHPQSCVAVVSSPLLIARAMLPVVGSYAFSQIAPVHYINHLVDTYQSVGSASAIAPLLHKDRAYAHELEVRAVICGTNWIECNPQAPISEGRGIGVTIDPKQFIRRIVLAPKMPKFVADAVRALVNSRYEVAVDVDRSRFDDNSFFADVAARSAATSLASKGG